VKTDWMYLALLCSYCTLLYLRSYIYICFMDCVN